MRPLDLVVPALASAVLACSSGPHLPPGFSTAYVTESADGGAPPAFRSLRGTGAGFAWALGEGGIAARLSGQTWTPVDTGTTATLGGVSTFTVSSAYAVELGGARVLAWNGRAWTGLGADRADRAAAATWGLAPNDVWVAGDGVEHWDGQSWTQEVAGGAVYTSMFSSFRTDVWAVGPGGIQHYDGSAWAPVAAPVDSGALAAVWADQLWDAWFVGAKGTVLHWNGNALTAVVASSSSPDLTCVTGTSAVDVWAAGANGAILHFDGASWVQYTAPAQRTINAIWKAFDADVYFVDDTGAITRLTL